MLEIVIAIAKIDLFPEEAHERVSRYVAERFDEVLFVMEEMGYPGDRLIEIATRHILLKQHEDYGNARALIETNRILNEFQSDDEFVS